MSVRKRNPLANTRNYAKGKAVLQNVLYLSKLLRNPVNYLLPPCLSQGVQLIPLGKLFTLNLLNLGQLHGVNTARRRPTGPLRLIRVLFRLLFRRSIRIRSGVIRVSPLAYFLLVRIAIPISIYPGTSRGTADRMRSGVIGVSTLLDLLQVSVAIPIRVPIRVRVSLRVIY
nr:hypothetical protein [Thermus scotoductus]